jgi:hypothetical protein
MRCSVKRRSSHETHALRTAPRAPRDLTHFAMPVMARRVNLVGFIKTTCMCRLGNEGVKLV